jgi:hypothetical protein
MRSDPEGVTVRRQSQLTGSYMLRPPGKDFKKVSVASTLCPACALRVEHRTSYVIAAVQADTPDGTVTKLIANQRLVIHTCTASRDESSEASDA